VIGSGGTDANGNFIDAMGNPGIPVSPELGEGDCVYPYDQCEDELGAVSCIEPTAPAPALSRVGLGVVVSLLVLIAGAAFRRRRIDVDAVAAVARRRR
jgi:hypothetical protein